MKLNWVEEWAVARNPLRVLEQKLQMKWFKKFANFPDNAEILEIGCGRGAGARILMNTLSPKTVHAMDLDEHLVRMANKDLTRHEKQRITLSVGDAYQLPFQSESMDAVFGFGFLHHVPDWQHALTEVRRVLKPGGRYFLEEVYPPLYQNAITKRIIPHPEKNRFGSADLKEELNAQGFDIKGLLENKLLAVLAVSEKR